MLRFVHVNQMMSLFKGHLPSGFLNIRKPFATRKLDGREDEDQVELQEGRESEEVEEIAADSEHKSLSTREDKRPNVRVYRKMKLEKKDALELALSEYRAFREIGDQGVFSFNKKANEITDEHIARLHKEAFDSLDFSKELKGKISFTIQDLNNPNVADHSSTISKIEDMIYRGYANGIYSMIYERDFKTLIFKKSFLPKIDLFMKKQVMLENPQFFSEPELLQTLKLSINQPEYLPLLNFIRFIPNQRIDRDFSYSSHTRILDDFLKIYADSSEINYLALVHFYFKLSKGNFLNQINFPLFSEKLLNIYWGATPTVADRQRFRGHLYDLLVMKLNMEENQSLKYYFADMFLTAPTYDQGLQIVGNTLLIINRLLNNSTELNDLYAYFLQKFGEEKFNFYIKDSLPSILTAAHKNKLANICRQTVQNFNIQSSTKSGKQKEESKPVIVDILDQNFNQNNSRIFYIFDHNCELDNLAEFNIHETAKEAKETKPAKVQPEVDTLSRALKSAEPKEFLQLFYEECLTDTVSREIYEETQEEFISQKKWNEKSSEDIYAFLDKLTNKLESEFFPFAAETKLSNNLSYKTRRYNPGIKETKRIGLDFVPQKSFSTFFGKKSGQLTHKSLTFEPMFHFSSEDSKIAEKSASPFKDFLKKAEEVDKAVKEKQISQEELSKMKKTLFEEKEKERREEKKRKKAEGEEFKFSPIEMPTAVKVDVIIPEATRIFPADYWANIVGETKETSQLLSQVELHFLKLEDLYKAQSAIENFIDSEPLRANKLSNHKIAFYKMFYQPSIAQLTPEEIEKLKLNFQPSQLEIQPSEKLQITFNTNFGEGEKDYNKYLTSNVFHYSLGEKGYKTLLEVLQTDYKRKYFKKCISHIARYSTDISTENLQLIANICYEQKIAFTLIEIAHLFMKNGIINRPEQLSVIVERLRFFKDLSENAELLAKSFIDYTKGPFSIKLVEHYLDLLMKYGKYDKFMPIFDRLKESIGNQKLAYNNALSGEENLRLQEEFKVQNRQVLSKLYREFIHKLNQHNINSFSKLLLNEQTDLKLILSNEDYYNAIDVNKENLQELESILRHAKNSEDVKFATKICSQMFNVIGANPKKLVSLIPKIFDGFVYTHKINISTELASKIGQVMAKTRDSTHLSNFLDFLIKEGPPLKYSLKIAFLRLLNSSDDQVRKPHNLRQLETLFSKETQERLKNLEKTRQTKAATEEKPAEVVEAEKEVTSEPVTKAEPEKEKVQESAAPEQKKEGKGKKEKEKNKDAEKAEKVAEKKIPIAQPQRTKFMIHKESDSYKGPAKMGVRFRRKLYEQDEINRELEQEMAANAPKENK